MPHHPEDNPRHLYRPDGTEVFACIHCPNCYEMVNVRCWRCDWKRPEQSREDCLRLAASGMWDHERGIPKVAHTRSS